jgi:hypothetical protein
MDCREVMRSRGLLSGYLTGRLRNGLNLGAAAIERQKGPVTLSRRAQLDRRSALICRGPVAVHHQSPHTAAE